MPSTHPYIHTHTHHIHNQQIIYYTVLIVYWIDITRWNCVYRSHRTKCMKHNDNNGKLFICCRLMDITKCNVNWIRSVEIERRRWMWLSVKSLPIAVWKDTEIEQDRERWRGRTGAGNSNDIKTMPLFVAFMFIVCACVCALCSDSNPSGTLGRSIWVHR